MPLVPPSVSLPEITPSAVILVSAVGRRAGRQCHLGLFAGMTVSASHSCRRRIHGGAATVSPVQHFGK